MSLKQLKLENSLKRKKISLENLEKRKSEVTEQVTKLRNALQEAETEEDITEVEKELENFDEKEVNNIQEEINNTDEEIKEIEKELEEINKKVEDGVNNTKNIISERGIEMNNVQFREVFKSGTYYERTEVKEFYDKLRNFRDVKGTELLIPELVINRIMDIVGDYTTIYPIVDKIKIKGDARILIDTDDTEATWIEQTAKINTSDIGTIKAVDFLGFKVGKATFIDNSILHDSIINLDDYVCKKIARAIAKALDRAILKGEGSTAMQPQGILTSLQASNKVTAENDLHSIVKNIALIDTGKDSVGQIIAVMNRTTYYNRLLQYSINTDSSGSVVGKLPNLVNPDLLGIKIVFSNYMETDKILFGDFKKYTLVEREDISISSSSEYKFLDDKMTFMGKGRFDGKSTDINAFVLVELAKITTKK